jgi:hypothetical protein
MAETFTSHINSQDPAQEHLQELGYPAPSPTVPAGGPSLPPGGGRLNVPHYLTFGSIVNQISHTYRWTFDEAAKHSDQNKVAIRRDPVIYDALRTRQMPIAQLAWHIEPQNEADTAEMAAAEKNTLALKRTPRFQQWRMNLLEALWFGRYATQNVLRWEYGKKGRTLRIADFRPINGDKLVFKWSGQVGILVHPTFEGSWQVTDRGRAHFFTPAEREQLTVHKHEPEDSDFFDGDMAGAIHGRGLRDRV